MPPIRRADEEVPKELCADMERLHPQSYGWALSCCSRDRSMADEVLQTTYLKVLEGRARYNGQSSVKTWLFAVIRRTAWEHRRQSWLRRLVGLGFDDRCDGAPSPEERLDAERQRQRLVSALARLSARQREVLELVFYHEMTIEEAAETLALQVGTARVHYERGKHRLRELLGGSRP